MANGRPNAGDMTGRLKQDLAKEARLADAEEAASRGVQEDVETDEQRNGVFDPKTGERIDAPRAAHVAVEDVPEAPAFGGGGAARASEAVLTGKESPEQLDQLVANRKPFSPPDPGVVRRAQVKVRIDEDVEDMTFGMVNGEPNNFTFKEGFVYEVPIALADHLESRGLVRQWVG